MRKPLIHTHCHLICCMYIKGCLSIHIVWCWRCWDTWIQQIKAMSKVSKIFYRFQCFKCYVCWRRWRWSLQLLRNTAYRVLLFCYSCWRCWRCQILCTVLCIQGLLPLQGGKLFVTLYCIWKAFHLVGLAVHHHSVWGGSFVNFLGLVNYKGDCRQDAQPIPNS